MERRPSSKVSTPVLVFMHRPLSILSLAGSPGTLNCGLIVNSRPRQLAIAVSKRASLRLLCRGRD